MNRLLLILLFILLSSVLYSQTTDIRVNHAYVSIGGHIQYFNSARIETNQDVVITNSVLNSVRLEDYLREINDFTYKNIQAFDSTYKMFNVERLDSSEQELLEMIHKDLIKHLDSAKARKIQNENNLSTQELNVIINGQIQP